MDDLEISYSVSAGGILTEVSEPAWSAFALRNEAPELVPARVIGRPLERFISGPEVVAAYRAFHQALLRGLLPEIALDCRCDGPGVMRPHRLVLRLDRAGAEPVLRYTSHILGEEPRRPVALLQRDREAAAPAGLLKICSYCKWVLLPPGSDDGAWIPVELYEEQGGPRDVELSHGICARCRTRFVEPMLDRLREKHRRQKAGPP